jgi:hypothetical protein
MFIFGGIDNVLSDNKKMRIMGVLYFAVAIFNAYVVYTKYI